MEQYQKPHRTFPEQLEILKSRGLHVPDADVALHHLRTVGYYTLGGYLYSMRELARVGGRQVRLDRFLSDASFDHLVELYDFDCRLRRLCLEALEAIERAIKVKVAYNVGEVDAHAHHTGSLIAADARTKSGGGPSRHESWLQDHTRKVTTRSHDAISGFVQKYGLKLPIWVATDAMDFGDISRLFSLLDSSSQSRIAKGFELLSGPQMGSWTRAMCGVRNIAAHHERLWNRRLVDFPMKPKGKEKKFFGELDNQPQDAWSRPYAALLVIACFMNQIKHSHDWAQRMGQLLDTLPVGPGVNYKALGAPNDWKQNPLWGLATS